MEAHGDNFSSWCWKDGNLVNQIWHDFKKKSYLCCSCQIFWPHKTCLNGWWFLANEAEFVKIMILLWDLNLYPVSEFPFLPCWHLDKAHFLNTKCKKEFFKNNSKIKKDQRKTWPFCLKKEIWQILSAKLYVKKLASFLDINFTICSY